MIYTGIGSRETPPAILDEMTRIATHFDSLGYTLRSGGAKGADSAFALGASKQEIFLPWNGFNGLWESEANILVADTAILNEAKQIAKGVHPNWNKLSIGAQKLHTRNVFQILGATLDLPSDFVLYWCPMSAHGTPLGGTATAVKLAKNLNIPTIFVQLKD